MDLFKVLLTVLAAIGLWAVPTQAQAEKVRAAGSGVGIALARLLAEQYQRENPATVIWIPESVGTPGAVKGLAAGKIDVGILARPLKAGEVEGGESIPICRTPLVFFVNAGRKDVSLSRRDLSGLFSNSLPPFPNGEVRALLRPVTDSGFIRLLEAFPDLASAVSAARDSRGANLALTDQEAMDITEASRSMVSFGAYAPLLAEKRKLIAVPLDGVMPGVDTLSSGLYPHDLALVFALPANASAAARSFVDYARSPAAAPLLRANGCLPSVGR
jgi:phosphate transport system substrate-binding protein